MNDKTKVSGKLDKSIGEAELADLIAATKTATAGVDDGFWVDVALQLDKNEESRKLPVDARK